MSGFDRRLRLLAVRRVVSRTLRCGVVASAVLMAPSIPASATPVLPDPPAPTVPVPERDLVSDPDSLVPIPSGCPVPNPADVAFVGTVVDKDEFVEKGTVRYRIDQLRAGDATPYAISGLIDIRYGPDSQYIDLEEQYLVAAAVDPSIAALASKVAPESPLFGGDAVVGLEDTEIECPQLDDPVMTLQVDGTAIDSGLLDPLFDDKRLLLATIGVPAAVVAAVLVGLVLLRRVLDVGFRGIFALGRAAVTPSPDHGAARVRRHLTEMEADDSSADGIRRSIDGDDELVDA